MVSIILVNWRGWRDTILCLQSLFHMRGADYRVVVCDNASGDESVDMIRLWAEGRLSPWVPPGHVARALTLPLDRGPVGLTELATGDPVPAAAPRLTLLHTGANLGFAGGCNAGMRHVVTRDDTDAVWLLNNDTVVEPPALAALVARAEGHERGLLASSVIRYLNDPRQVWFEGGVFDPRTALGRHVTREKFAASASPFLTGCALLITRAAWERLGLLDESFFMYGEDVDYSLRALEHGVPLEVVTESVVYHAEGASSGMQSAFAYENIVSGGFRVSRRYFPAWTLLPALAYHVSKLLFLLAVKRRSRAAMAGYAKGIVSGLRA
jgi:GT2 family glycosyltransferase